MSLLFCLLTLALASAFAGAGAEPARPQQASARTVYADRFPGGDAGARINAADRSLGASAGEIVARGGGQISTQIVVSEGHTLRLMRGTYSAVTNGAPILLKRGASLLGEGWDATIILESVTPGKFTVVSAFNNAQDHSLADSDISIKNLQIKGANPGFESTQQAISLGNCSRCAVDRVWINGTRSIGIQVGGSSYKANFAQGTSVTNCLFTRVASQNLALVNGRDITFENNRFITAGQAGGPGSTNIDLEPNDENDHIENVIIRNNFIDVRDSELPTTGNGIVVQSGSGTPHVGPILIEGNTIIGGHNDTVVTNVLSNGIFAFGPTMKDVTIRRNRVTRTGQSGLWISGTRFTVTDNQFVDVGGGGLPGFHVQVTDSRIVGNSFTYSGKGSVDSAVEMAGTNRNNIIRDNPGISFPPVIR